MNLPLRDVCFRFLTGMGGGGVWLRLVVFLEIMYKKDQKVTLHASRMKDKKIIFLIHGYSHISSNQNRKMQTQDILREMSLKCMKE